MTLRDHTHRTRPHRRGVLTLAGVALTAAALSTTLLGPAAAAPHAGPAAPATHSGAAQERRGQHRPGEIALPADFQPEGITVGRAHVAYLGSRVDGDIYATDLRTGVGSVLSQGPGTASVGLKARGDRLYVAGGASGTARVVSTRTGAVLASYPLTTGASFVNDVVLARRAAWFTDSLQPRLHRVAYARHAGRAEVTTLELGGDWVQTPGVNNANGIVLSPDGRSLLVVQSNTGFLFRVDPGTGRATRVDLGGTLLTNGDGLLLRGRTLYAVQNRDNRVAVLHLDRAGRRGSLVDVLTTADLAPGTSFDVPTTVALDRGSLYLPNARFGTAGPEPARYWVSRLPL